MSRFRENIIPNRRFKLLPINVFLPSLWQILRAEFLQNWKPLSGWQQWAVSSKPRLKEAIQSCSITGSCYVPWKCPWKIYLYHKPCSTLVFVSMSYELMFPKDFDFDKLLPTDCTPCSIISSVTSVTSAQPPLPTWSRIWRSTVDKRPYKCNTCGKAFITRP